ncbi:hypothetical protein V8G54_015179, partial [Vigna mungo]
MTHWSTPFLEPSWIVLLHSKTQNPSSQRHHLHLSPWPFRFLHIPIPPSLDTDKDRGCRTSLGLPPPAPTLSLLTLDSPFFLFQSFELTPPLEPNPITFLSLSQTLHRWRRIAAPTTQNSFSKPNSPIPTKLGQHFVGDNGGAGGGRTVAAWRWTQRATHEKNQTAKWRFLCAREMEDAKTIRLVMEVRLVAVEIGLVAVEIGLVAVEVAGEEGGVVVVDCSGVVVVVGNNDDETFGCSSDSWRLSLSTVSDFVFLPSRSLALFLLLALLRFCLLTVVSESWCFLLSESCSRKVVNLAVRLLA